LLFLSKSIFMGVSPCVPTESREGGKGKGIIEHQQDLNTRSLR
jgi:hypothetical protein